ncbi:MAG: AAA family ATPase [Desulfovibrionaceae bacterium]
MTSPAVITPIEGSPAQVRRAAKAYAEAGRSVVMCWATGEEAKNPTHKWKEFQGRCQTPEEIDGRRGDAVALICGKVSGNLECVDFDDKGSLYALWRELVEAEAPGLLDRLTVEQSPSGGYHVTYLCPEALIAGNTELALRPHVAKDKNPIQVAGKELTPGKYGDQWIAVQTLIETRGEKGYFVCAPSPGYKLLQGNHRDKLATITPQERVILLDCARSLTEWVPPSEAQGNDYWSWFPTSLDRPGDAFNADTDSSPSMEEMIVDKAGWKSWRTGSVYDQFTRPGKDRGPSGSIIKLPNGQKLFRPFTSNGHPFEQGKAYTKFSVYALLNHGNDFSKAAEALRAMGYGKRRDGEKQGNKNPAAGIVSASDLLAMDIPELRWAVPGFLPEGLTVLAGNPKVKKSWLALGAMLAIGAGQPVLGKFETSPAKCLYLALEDSRRRLQDRIHKITDPQPDLASGLDNVLAVTEWPTMDEGGLEALDAYAEANPDLKLIVVDTLVKMRPKTRPKGMNAYEIDSIHLGQIKALADRRHLGVVVITHLNKTKITDKGDPFDRITGSNGIFGVADTAMLLVGERGSKVAELKTTGRDIEGQDYAVEWSDFICSWSITGKAIEVKLTGERQEIIEMMRAADRPVKTAEVARFLKKTSASVSYLLGKMLKDGCVESPGYGLYSLKENP